MNSKKLAVILLLGLICGKSTLSMQKQKRNKKKQKQSKSSNLQEQLRKKLAEIEELKKKENEYKEELRNATLLRAYSSNKVEKQNIIKRANKTLSKKSKIENLLRQKRLELKKLKAKAKSLKPEQKIEKLNQDISTLSMQKQKNNARLMKEKLENKAKLLNEVLNDLNNEKKAKIRREKNKLHNKLHIRTLLTKKIKDIPEKNRKRAFLIKLIARHIRKMEIPPKYKSCIKEIITSGEYKNNVQLIKEVLNDLNNEKKLKIERKIKKNRLLTTNSDGGYNGKYKFVQRNLDKDTGIYTLIKICGKNKVKKPVEINKVFYHKLSPDKKWLVTLCNKFRIFGTLKNL